MANSFVENVNALANATSLATGDVVEDTQEARDSAVAAAAEALDSETNAKSSEELAQSWAEKGYNNPVAGSVGGGDAEYSAYHWSTEASLVIGDPLINDLSISTVKTWSSTKLDAEFGTKSATTHIHAGVYEPVFAKGTAFNQNFITASGESGSLETVARSDHKHDLVYEPKFTKLTAFNKDFGTTSGTVMEGDTNFDTSYMPLATIFSAYNKSFVADALNPTSDEIPRGNHIHAAAGVTYDNTSTTVGSSTVQGAITEISAAQDEVTVAEATFITLLGHTQYTQVISAQNTPTKVMMPLPKIQANKNATNNSNSEIIIDYASSAKGRPDKLIEGVLSVAIKLSNAENFAVNIAVDDVIAGESMKGTADLVVGQFITNIDVTDTSADPLKQSKLSIWLTNLDNAANAVIESMNVVWRGSPEGALVSSGSTISHSDLTGTGAANGVHTTSDIFNLDTELLAKADKIGTPVENNILTMDAQGNLKDSGKTAADLDGMNLVVTPTLDHIIVMDSGGQSKDGGLTIAGLALNAGDVAVAFKVANSTADNEAVNQGQMNGLAATYVPTTTYNTFIARTDNPHSVTYTQTGGAQLVHTHVVSDVTGLQDELDGKYLKVVTPVSDNAATFGAGGILKDSGQSLLSVELTGEAV